MSARPRRSLRWLLQAVGTAATGGVLGILGQVAGALVGSLPLMVVLRSAGALVALIVLNALFFRVWRERSLAYQLGSAALAYVLMPLAWGGQTLAGSLLTGPGAASFLTDLLGWLVVAVVVVAAQRRRYDPATDPHEIDIEWAH